MLHTQIFLWLDIYLFFILGKYKFPAFKYYISVYDLGAITVFKDMLPCWSYKFLFCEQDVEWRVFDNYFGSRHGIYKCQCYLRLGFVNSYYWSSNGKVFNTPSFVFRWYTFDAFEDKLLFSHLIFYSKDSKCSFQFAEL